MTSVLRSISCGLVVCCGLASGLPVRADAPRLTKALETAEFTVGGQTFTIRREGDPGARLREDFSVTARACPPFCVQPMQAMEGIPTLGELELIAFLQGDVAGGRGALIDARLPDWFSRGSLPSAVNLPFTALAPDNPFRNDILVALGARALGGGQFDFDAALDLVVFCNGAWSDQSLRALQYLRAAGYPAEKLSYYRGGMQDWLMLGLTTTGPVGSAGGG